MAILGQLRNPQTSDGLAFTGALKPGSGGVTLKSTRGLWAQDSHGVLRLAFRQRQNVMAGGVMRTVATFIALEAAPGIGGSGRGFTPNGHLYVQANFTDGTQAVLEVALP